MARMVRVVWALLVASSLYAQSRPESSASRPAALADLDQALTLLDRSDRLTRLVSLQAVRAELDALTKDAGLDAPSAESMPETRGTRRAMANSAIDRVAARMPLL